MIAERGPRVVGSVSAGLPDSVDMHALRVLAGYGADAGYVALPIRVIADDLGLSNPAVSERLRGLVASGHVSRRRAIWVWMWRLTPRGIGVLWREYRDYRDAVQRDGGTDDE